MRKGQWKERYFKENWTHRVYYGLLWALERENEKLQKLIGEVKEEELRKRFQAVADALNFIAAQATGKNADFDLKAFSMPEQSER